MHTLGSKALGFHPEGSSQVLSAFCILHFELQ
jgi:hypothetical protein